MSYLNQISKLVNDFNQFDSMLYPRHTIYYNVSNDEIRIPIPGQTKEDVSIELKEKDYGGYTMTIEHKHGSASYPISKSVDTKAITARVDAGMLYIATPQKKKKVRKIEVL